MKAWGAKNGLCPKFTGIRRKNVKWIILAAAFISAALFAIGRLAAGKYSVVKVFDSNGYALTGSLPADFITGKAADTDPLADISAISANSSLYRAGNDYYIRGAGGRMKKLNKDFPVFLNDCTYLYLYHGNFTLITDKFSVLKEKNDIYLSGGMAFNSEKKREGGETVILLKLPDGLYINADELRVKAGNSNTAIPMHSVLYLRNNGISYCMLKGDKPEFKEIAVSNSMVTVAYAGDCVSYDVFLERLKHAEDENKDFKSDRVHVGDELYQYFLGQRYEYKGEKEFYRIENGYFMETGSERFLVYRAPFYFAEEKRLLLPCDYVLVQPKLYRMGRLAAMSEIAVDGTAAYVYSGESSKTYTDLFLFDGADCYIFFDASVICWDTESIRISGLSQVIAEKDGTIEIYDYGKNRCKTFNAGGYRNVYAKMENGMSVNLSTDVLYHKDGREQALFSKPSLLADTKQEGK